jgi:acyl-CoA dehydrogenase
MGATLRKKDDVRRDRRAAGTPEALAKLCERFGDDYWLKKDTDGGFPHECTGRSLR